MHKAVVTRSNGYQHVQMESGELVWFTSKELGNSKAMTIGRAVIRVGQMNPRHYHPNCEEVLHVLSGRILHTMGDEQAEIFAGDTVTIPAGVIHNARNLGEEDAVMLICFSSADRQTVWV